MTIYAGAANRGTISLHLRLGETMERNSLVQLEHKPAHCYALLVLVIAMVISRNLTTPVPRTGAAGAMFGASDYSASSARQVLDRGKSVLSPRLVRAIVT